jgi:hypothetical protein
LPTASDDFNRADGGLGSDWTVMASPANDATPLTIASNKVVGGDGHTDVISGSKRTAESFASDQYSSVEVADALPIGFWIGATVRCQPPGGGSESCYLVIYFRDGGSSWRTILYREGGSVFTELANHALGGALTAGTVLKLVAVGTRISYEINGVEIDHVTDANFSGGAPGIMTFGAPTLDNWIGSDVFARPRFESIVVA